MEQGKEEAKSMKPNNFKILVKVIMLSILLILLSFASKAKAEELYRPLRVLVVDTGVPENSDRFKRCPGLKDIDLTNTELSDSDQHSTSVSNLILNHAGEAKVCFNFIKYVTYKSNLFREHYSNEAFKIALEYDPDILVYASYGEDPDPIEKHILTNLVLNGTAIFVAAGNDGQDLKTNCNQYPACYKAVTKRNFKSLKEYYNANPLNKLQVASCIDLKATNKRGPISHYEYCAKKEKVTYEVCLGDKLGTTSCQTKSILGFYSSQATAVAAGKFINYFHKRVQELK